MTHYYIRPIFLFSIMTILFLVVGTLQSWNLAVSILNLCIISAIMSLGVNMQWGYAGLFNVGIMGFAALGGMAVVLTSTPPVMSAWSAGGLNLGISVLLLILLTALIALSVRFLVGIPRITSIILTLVLGYFAVRYFYDPAVSAIESDNPAKSGFLGGLGLPVLLSWLVGGLFAAVAAWLIGKVSLGLRSDYLAIATLGISEIIIAVTKNEDWLTRGVKNVTGLPRPVSYEVDLQSSDWFVGWVEWLHSGTLSSLDSSARADTLGQLVISSSSLTTKLMYTGLFLVVFGIILTLCVLALSSPWGRMMRAIRDNEVSASAMGKNVTLRHLQIFVLGSATVGIAGAMLTTLDGQFTPGTYHPLRFTFLIWVMVIVGGSGNNLGSVLGAFLVWFTWIEAEPVGLWLISFFTSGLDADSPLRIHLLDSAQHMRLVVMGLVMLLVMRFSPGGLLPESLSQNRKQSPTTK